MGGNFTTIKELSKYQRIIIKFKWKNQILGKMNMIIYNNNYK